MAKITVRREIVYEGEEAWIRVVLAKSLRVGKRLDCGKGQITISQHHEYPEMITLDEDYVEGKEVPYGA